MLRGWERQHPGRVETIFRSICNVAPSQLADVSLYPFRELRIQRPDSESDAESGSTLAEIV